MMSTCTSKGVSVCQTGTSWNILQSSTELKQYVMGKKAKACTAFCLMFCFLNFVMNKRLTAAQQG
jgi:hypothetical protein